MPTLNPEIIAEFKRNLASATDFGSVMTFFFDHLIDTPGFIDRCRPATVPDSLLEVVQRAADAGSGHAVTLADWHLMEVPEAQILHGVLGVDGRLATLVWAADIQIGMLAVAQGPGRSDVLFVRLSLAPARPPGKAN